MEQTKAKKFTQSLTFKGFIIAALVLLLLIPQSMIMDLIYERKERSQETVEKINEKWSNPQTICGPILSIPYLVMHTEIENIVTKDNKTEKREKIVYKTHTLSITPEQLNIKAELFPEEKHYGIYKTILYKSSIKISGNFKKFINEDTTKYDFQWDKAYLTFGLSDLKGVSEKVDFKFCNQPLDVEAGGNIFNEDDSYYNPRNKAKRLIMTLPESKSHYENETMTFECNMSLNGSESINFIPLGKTTHVDVEGKWATPSFTGSFSPESKIDDGFSASWKILHLNRNIPESWLGDYSYKSLYENSFGVDLINTVDHYRQNMRSIKYAILFIALTFVVFFFVEALTKRKIHPLQYLLVGMALVLFYSLLLSISEQLNFAVAYLVSSIAIIGLITAYAYSIFKNKTQTILLTALLCGLYIFLYVILQLEDMALLIGSVGLFVILGVIMFVSRKINFYKQDDTSLTIEN